MSYLRTTKPRTPSELARSPPPVKKGSPLRSAEHLTSLVTSSIPNDLSLKRKASQNDLICLSRRELESELQQFIKMLTQQKSLGQLSSVDHLNYLKKVISKLCVDNPRSVAEFSTQDSDMFAKTVDFSAACEVAELEKRVYELEIEKRNCEKNIKGQAAYVTELEEKVKKLAEEQRKTLKKKPLSIITDKSQEVPKARPISPRSPMSASAILAVEQIGNLIENEEKLYEENETIKEEMRILKLRIAQYERGHLSFEGSPKSGARSPSQSQSPTFFERASANLSPIGGQQIERINILEDSVIKLREENIILNDSLKHLDNIMQEMQKQNSILLEENTELRQQVKSIEESASEQSNQYLLHIEQLTNALKEADQNIRNLNKKCERFHKLIQSKTEMETLLKSKSEIVQGLEEKLEDLVQEKSFPKLGIDDVSLRESKIIVMSQRRDTFGAVSPKNSSTPSFSKIFNSSNIEGNNELISNGSIVMKAYEDKIKALQDVNAKLEKDVAILSNELVHYREEVHWITKELKKYLDSYKQYDLEIERKLNELASRNDPDLLRLKNLYAYAKKDIFKTLVVIEERQKPF